MSPWIKADRKSIPSLTETTLFKLGITERDCLMSLIVDHIDIFGYDIMVISVECHVLPDSRSRLDILAMDRNMNLIVLELKRSGCINHMEVQSIRYLALVDKLNYKDLVVIHQKYLSNIGAKVEANESIACFTGCKDINRHFNNKPKVILIGESVRNDTITTVTWLNKLKSINIKCYTITAYILENNDTPVIKVQQIIPGSRSSTYFVRS